MALRPSSPPSSPAHPHWPMPHTDLEQRWPMPHNRVRSPEHAPAAAKPAAPAPAGEQIVHGQAAPAPAGEQIVHRRAGAARTSRQARVARQPQPHLSTPLNPAAQPSRPACSHQPAVPAHKLMLAPAAAEPAAVAPASSRQAPAPALPHAPTALPHDAIAIIAPPQRSTTQSGRAARGWRLRFAPRSRMHHDPLTGWIGSNDPLQQVELRFPTRAAAERYAAAHGLSCHPPAPATRTMPAVRHVEPPLSLCCWPTGPHPRCCGNYPLS